MDVREGAEKRSARLSLLVDLLHGLVEVLDEGGIIVELGFYLFLEKVARLGGEREALLVAIKLREVNARAAGNEDIEIERNLCLGSSVSWPADEKTNVSELKVVGDRLVAAKEYHGKLKRGSTN
jgi:hypothetical protein